MKQKIRNVTQVERAECMCLVFVVFVALLQILQHLNPLGSSIRYYINIYTFVYEITFSPTLIFVSMCAILCDNYSNVLFLCYY